MILPSFNFNHLQAKNKIVVIAAIFIACGFLLVCLVIIPASSDINDLKIKIINQKIELEQRTARSGDMKQSSENLSKIGPQLDNFEQIFINQGRDLEFITTLEAIAHKNNIEQKISLSQPSARENTTYKKIPLELTTSGEYYALLNYLADLESLNYYLIINSLEFSNAQSSPAVTRGTGKDKPTEGNIALKIVADTYWQ